MFVKFTHIVNMKNFYRQKIRLHIIHNDQYRFIPHNLLHMTSIQSPIQIMPLSILAHIMPLHYHILHSSGILNIPMLQFLH